MESGQTLVLESGGFEWPWSTPIGLAIITGGSGGGGGGGGALCIHGLNLYGGGGGGGGGGGSVTSLTIGHRHFEASGGSGGSGGDSGGLFNGQPTRAQHGSGCHFGNGGTGGKGAAPTPDDGQIISNGGDGGKGFPGETLIIELSGVSIGEELQIEIGEGGGGGGGGEGYVSGGTGTKGDDGSVRFIPIYRDQGGK